MYVFLPRKYDTVRYFWRLSLRARGVLEPPKPPTRHAPAMGVARILGRGFHHQSCSLARVKRMTKNTITHRSTWNTLPLRHVKHEYYVRRYSRKSGSGARIYMYMKISNVVHKLVITTQKGGYGRIPRTPLATPLIPYAVQVVRVATTSTYVRTLALSVPAA